MPWLTPTVTSPPSAGASPSYVWRKSTARALLRASRWALTSFRAPTWSGESPRTAVLSASQARAAVVGLLAPVSDSRPSAGRIDDGVPSAFQEIEETPIASAASRWTAVGERVPSGTKSEGPVAGSPRKGRTGVGSAVSGAAALVPRLTNPAMLVSPAIAAAASARRGPEVLMPIFNGWRVRRLRTGTSARRPSASIRPRGRDGGAHCPPCRGPARRRSPMSTAPA